MANVNQHATSDSDESSQSKYSVEWASTALKYLRLGAQESEPAQSTSSEHLLNGDSEPSDQAHRVKSKPRLDDGSSVGSTEEEVLHKLSKINGEINKMTKEELEQNLRSLNLNSCGVKDVLKKRLKFYHKRQRYAYSNRLVKPEEKMLYDYLVVIDFEATCSETNFHFLHEIIEFPAVLVDAHTNAVCNVFQRFCKPTVNPRLTDFCTTLTGITQAQVDKAKSFTEVFAEFQEWMRIHGLGTSSTFAILTDGPWDMARFLKTQTEISRVEFPSWAKHWINLRKAYSAFYGCGRVNLQKMLDDLGMVFQGRPHCGLDDARNIANIAIRLLNDGCVMRVNEHFYENGKPRLRQTSSTSRQAPRSGTQQKQQPVEDYIIPQEGENFDDLLLYSKLQKD